MLINARFLGKDGDFGYQNGRLYFLIFFMVPKTMHNNVILIESVDPVNDSGRCEYPSLRNFLDNWVVS